MITQNKLNYRQMIARMEKSIQNPTQIADLVALLYQENSKMSKFTLMKQGEAIGRFSNPYMLQRASQPYKCFPTSEIISLKEYEDYTPPAVNIFDTFKNRRSVRKFDNHNLSINELYQILHYSYGVTGHQPVRGLPDTTWSYRAVPSGGALYPLEIYVYLHNSVLPRGMYHFRPDINALEIIEKRDYMEDLKNNMVAEPYIDLSNVGGVVFISSVMERTLLKYGERGYRFILQEVGFVSQNISLVCPSINLGTCMIGSFDDDKINEWIKADGTFESIQNIIVIGKERKHEADS
jgi:SagB-type dehydrogenase family enzyme